MTEVAYREPVRCERQACPASAAAVFRGEGRLVAPPKGWRTATLEPSKRVAYLCPEHRED